MKKSHAAPLLEQRNLRLHLGVDVTEELRGTFRGARSAGLFPLEEQPDLLEGGPEGREALDSRDPRGIDDSVLPVSVLASRGLGKDTDLMAVPQRPDDDVREARDFFAELLGVPLSERLPDERDDAAEHAADGPAGTARPLTPPSSLLPPRPTSG